MKCLVCGSKNLLNTNNEYKYTGLSFKEKFPEIVVQHCENCGVYQANIEDTPENNDKLFDYYKTDYRNGITKYPSLENKESLAYIRGETIAILLSKYLPKTPIKVFEKGCGFGFNLAHINKLFPESTLYTDELDQHVKFNLKEIGIDISVPIEFSTNRGGGG